MYSILLVEDNISILNMLQTVFTNAGATIFIADDGGKALNIIQKEALDIILLDIVLPTIDGLTLLEIIRKKEIQTPVILLTDKDFVEDKVKGLNLGANDYITKPFSTRELLARVNVQLRDTKNGNGNTTKNVIKVGKLTIAPHVREVILGEEQQIQLTKTEFDLLLFLANRTTEVVPHTQLLQDVLHYHTASETKSLVMHIANLRKKLRGAGETGIELKAITGVGYRLVEESM